MVDYIILILGVVCAGAGGELFVRGAVGLAGWARVSPGIIAVTIAAFATSSPELSVAINSALAEQPEITLGDALGSNVMNVALILALSLVLAGIQSSRDSIRRDFPVALLVPLVTGVLMIDGRLSRVDGFLMLGMFLVWLGATVMEVRKQRSRAQVALGEVYVGRAVIWCVAGLVFLVAAGKLIVIGARGIALSFAIDEFIIGATVVALGTSAPELATVMIAKYRGHDEIGLGTILGSNIFNGLFIIAVAATIHPIEVAWREVAATLVFGFLAVLITYPSQAGFIERRRGVLLLVLFAAYFSTILQSSLLP